MVNVEFSQNAVTRSNRRGGAYRLAAPLHCAAVENRKEKFVQRLLPQYTI